MQAANALRRMLGMRTGGPSVAWATHAWGTCLEQLRIQRDVVFFGDSLTELYDWQARFPSCSVANLGFYGDTLPGMLSRTPMVASLAPKKVFFLGGINSLREDSFDVCLADHARLFDELAKAAPGARVYVQSVLPIARAKERTVCRNATIVAYNGRLRALAEERAMTWVDLHPHFVRDGAMAGEYTTDGAHLTPAAYELWSGLVEGLVTRD